MPDIPDAHEPEPADTSIAGPTVHQHADAVEGVTPLDSHAMGVELLPLAEVMASTGALAAAVSTVAKAKIERRADVRKAEIEAETRRLEIEAETRRTQIQESAETRRERIRQQNGQPAIDPSAPNAPDE